MAATRRVRSPCLSSSPLHSTGNFHSCQFPARFSGCSRGRILHFFLTWLLTGTIFDTWIGGRGGGQISLWGVWFLVWQVLRNYAVLIIRYCTCTLQSLQSAFLLLWLKFIKNIWFLLLFISFLKLWSQTRQKRLKICENVFINMSC